MKLDPHSKVFLEQRSALNPSICVAMVANAGNAKTAQELERAVAAILDYWEAHLKRGEGQAVAAHRPIEAK